MKVAILSWSDLHGGAARAALRLHRALRAAGVESCMHVDADASDEAGVHGPRTIVASLGRRMAARYERLPLWRYPRRRRTLFSPGHAPRSIGRLRDEPPADVTHLHWTCNGFISVEGLTKLAGPLVWTLHDQWPFTGGCHYADGCLRYEQSCGACPALGSTAERDLSREIWLRKRSAWERLDLTIVAPSRWMARCAASSSLLRGRRMEVIPNCLDTDVFKPVDRVAARTKLGLPVEGKLLLFSALTSDGDRRKGGHFVRPVLEALASRTPAHPLALVVVGAQAPGDANLPFAQYHLGVLEAEHDTALAYAAADVFLALSMEDNLPNTVMEALSCGTPCVAFDVGGMGDMIESRASGVLVPPFDVLAYAEALRWVLVDEARHASLSARARATAERKFSPERIARLHAALYEELCKGASCP